MSFDYVVFRAIDFGFNYFQNRPSMMRKFKGKIDVEKDIVYDESDPKTCRLDTYISKTAPNEKHPVIFNVHGGGFIAGDKKYRRCLSSWFAINTNAFVVNVNNGLGPKYLFPTPLAHLVKALDWVYDNAEKYNLDLSKVIATGDSSGGYYVAELAALQGSKLMQEKLGLKSKLNITALMLNCGIYDIDRALSVKVLFNLSGQICKHFTGTDIKDIKSNPYIDVISSLPNITKDFPKSCVVYAKQDFFCGGQGEDLVNKLNELGVYNEVYYSTKFLSNHTFQSTWKGKDAVNANQLFLDFANKVIKGEI